MNAKYRGRGCAIDSSRIRAASSSASCTGTGPPGSPAPRSPRTRSSSGGSSGRNRSKLRQASATSLAACASASSRGASSRSGRSGSVMRSDGTRPRPGYPLLRSGGRRAPRSPAPAPSSRHVTIEADRRTRPARTPGREDRRRWHLVERAEDRRPADHAARRSRRCRARPCSGPSASPGTPRSTSGSTRPRARTRRTSSTRRTSRSSAGAPASANRSSHHSLSRDQDQLDAPSANAIAPVGVPYFAETPASIAGRRRSRAIANTPRVDATRRPDADREHVEEHDDDQELQDAVRAVTSRASGAPSANSGAPATAGLDDHRHVEPEPRHLRVRAIR